MSDITESFLNSLPPILDLKDLMRALRLSERTAYRLLKEAPLRAYQDDEGNWNVNRSDLIQWIQDKE